MALLSKSKAKLSPRLREDIKRIGGVAKHRALQGFLPRGYHQDPKKHKLSARQKARVRKMHKELNPRTFKRVYGFPIK